MPKDSGQFSKWFAEWHPWAIIYDHFHDINNQMPHNYNNNVTVLEAKYFIAIFTFSPDWGYLSVLPPAHTVTYWTVHLTYNKAKTVKFGWPEIYTVTLKFFLKRLFNLWDSLTGIQCIEWPPPPIILFHFTMLGGSSNISPC